MSRSAPGFNHLSHWGAFHGTAQGDELVITPARDDPQPSPLIQNWSNATRHQARVRHPAVRRGWLENGPGPSERRGSEEFVRLPWAQVLDIAAREIGRVYATSGPQSVFGGSYGWASAGRGLGSSGLQGLRWDREASVAVI